MATNKKSPFPSQLRQDIVSDDWVVIATGRAKRPDAFGKKEINAKKKKEKKLCRFCDILKYEKPILVFSKGEKIKSPPYNNWTTCVVANKYPAFSPSLKMNHRKIGPYRVMDGVGFHELVVTRDHRQTIAEMNISQIKEIIDAYQERYLDLSNEPLVNYVSIFHNQGEKAGATVAHPHSQIIAIPTFDSDIQSSINGSKRYLKKYGQCPHCTMIKYDQKDQKRVVFENKEFLVTCPFVSRVAFEVRIYPKVHRGYFERIKNGSKWQLAEAFKKTFKALDLALNHPDYNFFLHTAPCDGQNYDHYHWNWQIIPHTQIWAGFELGTEIEISTITPEAAAEFLRHKINFKL